VVTIGAMCYSLLAALLFLLSVGVSSFTLVFAILTLGRAIRSLFDITIIPAWNSGLNALGGYISDIEPYTTAALITPHLGDSNHVVFVLNASISLLLTVIVLYFMQKPALSKYWLDESKVSKFDAEAADNLLPRITEFMNAKMGNVDMIIIEGRNDLSIGVIHRPGGILIIMTDSVLSLPPIHRKWVAAYIASAIEKGVYLPDSFFLAHDRIITRFIIAGLFLQKVGSDRQTTPKLFLRFLGKGVGAIMRCHRQMVIYLSSSFIQQLKMRVVFKCDIQASQTIGSDTIGTMVIAMISSTDLFSPYKTSRAQRAANLMAYSGKPQ